MSEVAMLVARPIEVFRVGDRRVLACRVPGANANPFLGKAFSLFRDGHRVARITIEGVSTASPLDDGVFDLSYSGDEVRPDHVGEGSILTDGTYEDALKPWSLDALLQSVTPDNLHHDLDTGPAIGSESW